MHNPFIRLYQFIQKSRFLALGLVVLFLMVTGYFASKTVFEEEISQILPKSEKGDITAKVLKQLNFSDKITVIIEYTKEQGVEEENLAQVASEFVDSLSYNTYSPFIKNLQGGVNQENIKETFDFVYDNLPLFLDESDYAVLSNKINRDSIAKQVQSNYRSLVSPTGIVSRDFILKDPLGITFIALKKLQQLSVGDNFQLKNGYLTTKDGSTILLFITPELSGSETEKNTVFVSKLKALKVHLNTKYSGKVSLDYFGSSFIAVANAEQIQYDIKSTVIISMSLLMLLLMLFYKKITIPLLLFIPPLLGALAALTVLYFVRDSISAISLSIGAVLLGVTIDYSLHILTHYRDLKVKADKSHIAYLYRDITKPILISSTTTAIAFLCLLFVNSKALIDLGIFAAVSVLVSAIVSLLCIPHLYTPPKVKSEKITVLDRLAQFPYDKNKFTIGLVVVLLVVSLFTFSSVSYNNDLSSLNFVPDDIKQAEAKLEAKSSLTSKSIYTVTHGASLDEALNNNNKLFDQLADQKKMGSIINYSSIGGIVLSKENQKQKISKWDDFWDPQKKEQVRKELIEASEPIGFKPETHQAFYDLLHYSFTPIELASYAKVKALFIEEFVSEKDGLYTLSNVVKVKSEQREAFITSMKGSKNVIAIDRQQLNETFLGKLKDDFGALINYSLIAILIVLFLFFRRIELVLIGLVPIVLTGFVIAGVMGATGLQLNIFSTIVCTLIFGHGVDFSIFMTSALQKQYTTGRNEIRPYKASILLAVLTTTLAVGVLIFAKHPALKSLSVVSLIGIFSAVLITFVLYPILFRFCISNRPKKGRSPVSLRLMVHSTLSFMYYGIGGLLLPVIGKLILSVLPFSKEKRITLFRKLISKFMKSVLYLHPTVRKTVINEYNEDFVRPAVIIANHTSFLDTLAVGMLSHKVIFLVNDWVYNSPIIGPVVRLAGFYPVSQGIEGGISHLKPKVDEGYSLMIFPEGKRSHDNHIHRFHKGAFLLAEEFKIDVLPVYIHGNSETLPYADHVIYDEQITVKVGQRIAIDDESFGAKYAERTKKISKYYKREFAELRSEIEGEDYFRKKLEMSFMYKEQDIQNEIKSDFEADKSLYYSLNQEIAPKGKMIHISDDYGQLDVMLTLQQPQRKLFTYIADIDKRDIANNNFYTLKRKLIYTSAIKTDLPVIDVLLISATFDLNILSSEVLQKVKSVVIIKEVISSSRFIELGFKVKKETEQILILKQ